MNRRQRLALQAFLALAIYLVLFERPPPSFARIRQSSPPLPICHLSHISLLSPLHCSLPGVHPDPQDLSNPCRWRLLARSNDSIVRLVRPFRYPYTAQEVSWLRQLDGCDNQSSCANRSVTCQVGVEDPSDALWLRDYQQTSKFIVIFRIGAFSLVFYILAILAEGSIFYPHRPGSFAPNTASIFAIIASAALLYVMIVPRKWQISLWGAGWMNTVLYILTILTIAALLPAVTISWVSFCLFAIFFVGFVVEQILCLIAGILHYLGALSVYQAANTLFHLRLIYNRRVDNETQLDRELLVMSSNFLERVRRNVFLYRVPQALEQDGLQVVESTLPDHLFEELVADTIPLVSFEDAISASEDGDPSGSEDDIVPRPVAIEAPAASASTPLLSGRESAPR